MILSSLLSIAFFYGCFIGEVRRVAMRPVKSGTSSITLIRLIYGLYDFRLTTTTHTNARATVFLILLYFTRNTRSDRVKIEKFYPWFFALETSENVFSIWSSLWVHHASQENCTWTKQSPTSSEIQKTHWSDRVKWEILPLVLRSWDVWKCVLNMKFTMSSSC